MAKFDAEQYLRQAGERWVREDGSSHGLPCNPVLSATGAALVAVGAITPATARAVIGDYDAAVSPDEGDGHAVDGQVGRPVASAQPAIRHVRVVPCGRVIGQPWGRLTIQYVAFTDRATTLRVTLEPSHSQGHPFGQPVPAGAQRLRVTDDHGTVAYAEFSGGSRRGDPAWRGEYEARPLLGADTAWIELLGQRVELTAKPAGIQVWTEPLPAQDPAVRHLWERVATLNDFHDPHLALDVTIAALVAAGTLPVDDPVIADARAVLAVLRPRGARPAEAPGDLLVPWRSLLARWGQDGGPVGFVTVGVIVPPFDGVAAAIVVLESRDEFFGINVELAPGVRTGLPYCDLPGQQYLTWWAADDLGNYYLGEQGSWYSDEDRCWGAIGFWPALDPRASRIDLMPTATTMRAIIRVPLPWAKGR